MSGYEELIVKVKDVNGSYYQIGLQQSKELLSLLQMQKDVLMHLTKSTNTQIAKQLLQKHCPQIIHEMEGLSAGAALSIDTVLRLFSGYTITFPEMGCTAFVRDGMYIRNYDFSPALYDARFVFSKPVNGYASIGFSQQIIGRLDGMNEYGLVVGLHFVNHEHSEEGFIASTIVRVLLEQCKTIEEACMLIKEIPHGYCYNYSMTDCSGRAVVVEASPQKQIIKQENPLICTNHFESIHLIEKNKKMIEGSIHRKQFLTVLLEEELTTTAIYQHFNAENSPLFYHNYHEYFGTLHTIIYQPKTLEILVGIGGNAQPTAFSFKEYLKGALMLPKEIKGIIYTK